MPKNNISTGKDKRKRYRYTDSSGKPQDVRQRKDEGVSDFKLRCEELESVETPFIKMTFSELFEKWQLEFHNIYCGAADIDAMKNVYNTHVKNVFGHMHLNEITRPLVYKLLTGLVAKGKSKSLVSYVRGVISRPYNWAINDLGYKIACPTVGLRIKTKNSKSESEDDKEIRIISDEEFNRFFDKAKDSKYYNYFMVLRYAGTRPSEALGLKVSDDKGDVLVIRRGITRYGLSVAGKTASAKRNIPITPLLREALDNQKSQIQDCKKDSWLFPTAEGSPTMNSIVKSFGRIKRQTAIWKKVGRKYHGILETPPLNFNLYNFRHTFATNAARVLRPNILQYIMGHKSIEVTLRYYVGLTSEDKESASIELSKIFSLNTGQNTGQNA